MWPTPEECDALLRSVGADTRIAAHSTKVAEVAAPIAEAIASRGHDVDLGLVTAGAHLHDIGRSRSHGLDHASLGAAMLRDIGYPEPLCLVVERHTGGGIDPDQAKALGLAVRDYTPRSLEERLVCQADNLVDGTRRQKVQEELDDLRSRGLGHVADKIRALHDDLSRLAGQDLDLIK